MDCTLLFIHLLWNKTTKARKHKKCADALLLDKKTDDYKKYYQLCMNDARDVVFTLYTQSKKTGEVFIKPTLESIKQSNYDPDKKTKIITHGFLSSGKSNTCQQIKDEYLASNDYNVIVMNWSRWSNNPIYFIPAYHTRIIGEYYGYFIDLLIESGTDPKRIHLIGDSLGAHVAGYAGSSTKKGNVGRITGTDPAYPMFGMLNLTFGRLTKSSADFVDIIHSCGGKLGLYDALGHVDFYPNGGRSQPGCRYYDTISIGACSHGRSWQYFKESINSNLHFQSYKCPSYEDYENRKNCSIEPIKMGEHVPHAARGKYYLKTNSAIPYAKGSVNFTR